MSPALRPSTFGAPLALAATLLAALLASPGARAQTGTLDQVSPDLGTVFDLSNTGNVWQQEVRAGVGGTLSAIEVPISGDAGAHLTVRLRDGVGWNTTPALWSSGYVKVSSGVEQALFDLTAIGYQVTPGSRFVIEVRGSGAIAFARGSYVMPSAGAPWYPEPLYRSGPGCFADCGWRMAFRTWVESGSTVTPYCTATVNSTGFRALMSSSGSTSVSANDLVLTATNVLTGQPGMFLMGATQTQQPLGPGFLCVALPFHRLLFSFGVAGQMTWDLDLTTLPATYAVQAGSTWNFQCWYRDPVQAPGYNLSNGLSLTFTP